MTVKHTMEYFYETHAKGLKSGNEVKKTARLINEVIGTRKIIELDKADIMKLKATVGDNSESQANKCLAWLSSALNHCRGEIKELHGVINVCQFVTKYNIHGRDTYVTADEMPRLLESIKKEPNPYGRAAVILYILLGQRKDEILRIEHRNIDMQGKRVRWPDTKNGKKHHVPLSDEAMEVIKRIPRVIGSPWLFPAINPPRGLKGQDHLKDIRHSWDRIREDAGMTHITVHDLRRTLGSWMAMGGEPLALIGKILNHSSPAVTAEHYAHFDDKSQREALNRHAKKVLSIR
jgi:integrase